MMEFSAAIKLGLAFRPMTPADMPFLSALYASTRADEVAATGWPASVQRQFLQQQFEAQHRHYVGAYPDVEMLVIAKGGKDVGRLTLNETPASIGLVDIAFLPGARGFGLGGAIVGDIVHHARAVQKLINLHVETHNPAKRLYLRHGFVSIDDGGVYERMEWSPITRR